MKAQLNYSETFAMKYDVSLLDARIMNIVEHILSKEISHTALVLSTLALSGFPSWWWRRGTSSADKNMRKENGTSKNLDISHLHFSILCACNDKPVSLMVEAANSLSTTRWNEVRSTLRRYTIPQPACWWTSVCCITSIVKFRSPECYSSWL